MGKIKKILVPNKVPIGTSFKTDEIIVNPIDGKAYIKKIDNTVIELGSGTTSGTDSFIDNVTQDFAGQNTLTFVNGDSSTFTLTIDTGSGGSGGTTTNALTVDDATLRLNTGTTFNGSVARTISIKDGGVDSDALAADIAVTTLTATHITASGNISASGTIVANKIESDQLISHAGDANTGLQFAPDTVNIESNDDIIAKFSSGKIILGNFESGFAGIQISGSIKITGSDPSSERTPLVVDGDGLVSIGNADYNLLQVPADGNYDDGLLPFTASDASSTTISDAIDDINEVLAGLAPSAAPSLDDISGSFGATSAKLSFGSQNDVSTHGGYTNVTSNTLSSPDNNFSLADVNTLYSPSVFNNDVKIGVVDARSVSANNNTLFTTIIGTLNDDTDADSGTFVNHGANAFGDGDKGVLALYINNNTTPVHSLVLSASGDATASSLDGSGSGFIDISATHSAHFVSSGNELTVFKHRSGSFRIQSSSQIPGWNYARVEHQLPGGNVQQTNYIEWVNEVDSASLSATAEDITDFTGAGSKFLSGVEYFTSFTATYKAVVTNVYKNVYSTSTSAILYGNNNTTVVTFDQHIATGSKILHSSANTVTGDSTTPSRTLPSLNTGKSNCEDTNLQLTASLKSKDNVACTTDGVAFTIELDKIDHPFKDDIGINVAQKSISDVLLDNRTGTSTLQKEIFVSESVGRIPSASYATQTSVTDAIGTFNSTASIANTTDLMVAPSDGDDKDITGNGVLVYPDNIKGGDYNALTNGPSSNVDYSSVSGDKNYYRTFKNESGGSLATVVIKIKGSVTLVTRDSEDNSSNDISCRIKYPETTAYLDLGAGQADGADLTVDNTPSNASGTPDTTIDSTGATNTLNLASSLNGGTISDNDHIVVNLQTGQGFTGKITEIEITNF
ncbi:hypothetical protein OAA39_00100 [bacterium]|nr:hypothetical protein [bacterium]